MVDIGERKREKLVKTTLVSFYFNHVRWNRLWQTRTIDYRCTEPFRFFTTNRDTAVRSCIERRRGC